MTFDALREEPWERPEDDPPVPAPELPTDGGGGTTLLASNPPDPLAEVRALPEAVPEETLGGGGTTS